MEGCMVKIHWPVLPEGGKGLSKKLETLYGHFAERRNEMMIYGFED